MDSPARLASETAHEESVRYAFYFAPEENEPLWSAGCAWLHRDPRQPQRRDPDPGGLPQGFIESPRRYGFHATLKAPMRLRASASRAMLLDAAAALARAAAPFRLPVLEIGLHRGFLALLPVEPPARRHPLRRLADAVVTGLDGFRAPSSAEERARHQAGGLGRRQQRMLDRWGYPWVLGTWRFHMTLTDPLPAQPALHVALRARAQAHFAAALAEPVVCRSLCLFEEPGPGAPFVLTERLPLGG